MNKVFQCIIVLALLLISFSLLSSASLAAEATCSPTDNPSSTEWNLTFFKSDPKCLADPVQARGQLGNVISTGITLFLIAGALSAFVMFIYGGFRYITAQDDSSKTKKARDTMQYAAIGLVVMSMVYVFILIYNNILPHG